MLVVWEDDFSSFQFIPFKGNTNTEAKHFRNAQCQIQNIEFIHQNRLLVFHKWPALSSSHTVQRTLWILESHSSCCKVKACCNCCLKPWSWSLHCPRVVWFFFGGVVRFLLVCGGVFYCCCSDVFPPRPVSLYAQSLVQVELKQATSGGIKGWRMMVSGVYVLQTDPFRGCSLEQSVSSSFCTISLLSLLLVS